MLDEATAIVSVTPRVQADFQAQTTTPVHLITNGYDESDFAAELPAREDGKFRVVHTGLFASDGNPLELWNALAGLCSESADFASRLEIRLAGKVDPEIVEAITEAGLGAQLHMIGYLPHPESVAELRQADIILLPLRHGPEYSKVYPGKIFECMAAGPFVLGIGPTDSAAAELLRATGTGEMFDWNADPSGFIRAAAAAPSAADKGQAHVPQGEPGACIARPEQRQRAAAASDYSRRALTEKLVTLLSALSE